MGILNKKKGKGDKQPALAAFVACDKEKLLDALTTVITAGHVFQISITRSGKAITVGIYDGKENDKAYPETSEEFDDLMDTILDAY